MCICANKSVNVCVSWTVLNNEGWKPDQQLFCVSRFWKNRKLIDWPIMIYSLPMLCRAMVIKRGWRDTRSSRLSTFISYSSSNINTSSGKRGSDLTPHQQFPTASSDATKLYSLHIYSVTLQNLVGKNWESYPLSRNVIAPVSVEGMPLFQNHGDTCC